MSVYVNLYQLIQSRGQQAHELLQRCARECTQVRTGELNGVLGENHQWGMLHGRIWYSKFEVYIHITRTGFTKSKWDSFTLRRYLLNGNFHSDKSDWVSDGFWIHISEICLTCVPIISYPVVNGGSDSELVVSIFPTNIPYFMGSRSEQGTEFSHHLIVMGMNKNPFVFAVCPDIWQLPLGWNDHKSPGINHLVKWIHLCKSLQPRALQ